MRLASFDAIAQALQDASVRYLVAGGLAVNAHGYLRFTRDIDLVLQLESGNVRRALAALGKLGYHPETPIDVFVNEPFPFDGECARALVRPLRADLDVRFVTIPTLIRMKELAERLAPPVAREPGDKG